MPKYVFNPFTAKLDIQASTKSDVGLSNVDNVQQIPLSYLDTDGTLSANSDTKVASQKATKTYADQLIGAANALVYKGTIDCSANPNYPAADAGHMYIVSVAGKIGGASGVNVEVGDMIICNTDGTASGNQATVGANFNIIEKNIEGAVSGPASAVTNNVATFDGVTGKIIKDSGVALGTLASQDGTFSGNGTLATGGFTLTVPATGTTALLGTAQTFTGVNTFNDDIISNSAIAVGLSSPLMPLHLQVDGSGGASVAAFDFDNGLVSRISELRTGSQGSSLGWDTNNFFSFGTIAAHNQSGLTATFMRIDTNGNVGIGTTSPAYKLEVDGTFRANTTTPVFGANTLTIPATGTVALLGTANTFTATQSIVVDQGNAELQAFTYRDTPSAGFFRANKARGTLASPTVVQDGDLIGGFIGNAYTGSVFFASTQVSLYADGPMGSQRIPGRIDLMTSDGTSSPAVRMVIKNNGNVGIGTTSPSELLELSKSTSYQLRLTNLGAGAGYWNIGQTSNGFAAGGGKLLFVPDSTSSNAATVTFTNTGKVGIGTTSPATSGLLDLTSTTGALIVPRMTTTQRNALTAVNGMIIYNTTTNTMQGRINGAWTDM